MSLEQEAAAAPVLAKGPWRFSAPLFLDITERVLVVALFAFFVHRLLPQLMSLILIETVHPEFIWAAPGVNGQVLLLVIGEALALALILLRRPSPTLSAHPLDWALSFGAVSAPLLFTTPAPPGTLVPSIIVTSLMLLGLVVQISAKFWLARSFGVVPANRGVKAGGPYRVLRHPMYFGYTLTHLGFLLGFPSLQNTLLYGAVFGAQVARLLREERILMRDPAYRAYASRVRYRLLPGLF